ncbi:MAG: hypothetical protein ACE5IY_04965 [bacterium]
MNRNFPLLIAGLFISIVCCTRGFAQNGAGLVQQAGPVTAKLTPDEYVLNDTTLQALPFRDSPETTYQLLPGSATQEYRGDNLLHVRGSRHDELSYSFEGSDIRSDFTGHPLFRFIPEVLAAVRLQSTPGIEQHGAAVFGQTLRRPAGTLCCHPEG